MEESRLEEVYANCLSALSARCGPGPVVLLMAQRKKLRLELASDLLPFRNELLKLDLQEIEKRHPLDSLAACEQTKQSITALIQTACPTRDVFVHCLLYHDQIQGALVQISLEGQTLDANLNNLFIELQDRWVVWLPSLAKVLDSNSNEQSTRQTGF